MYAQNISMCLTIPCSDFPDRTAIQVTSGDLKAGPLVRPLERFVPERPARTSDDGGGAAFNGQSALYAVGGPRSAQFTLKVIF